MKIIKDKNATILIINEVKCVVQSYIQDNYVNLSPIQTGRESIEDSLSNVRIDFINNCISTEGKENARWKVFVSALKIDEINTILKTKQEYKLKKIEFKKTSYQCRVVLDNTGNELIIGGTSLLDALQPGNFEDDNEGFADMEALNIYDEIFYFTNDNDLLLDDADLILILQKSNPEWF